MGIEDEAMNIDSVNPAVGAVTAPSQPSQEPRRADPDVIEAVHAINASNTLGDERELTFSLDRETQRPVLRIVDRVTREVIQQIPDERALRLAQDLRILSSALVL
ncbi:MAG: flagellar protein FlaG [Bryobacteraceae bacterium]